GMADAIDAGIWLTAPYGKSVGRRQMRQRDAAMRACFPLKGGPGSAPARARASRVAIKSAQIFPSPSAGEGERQSTKQHHFGLAAVSFAAFLHSDMNFLRSLPWTPLVSASFEHSSDAAVRGFSAFFTAGAAFAAGAGVAGVVVCANAELIRNRDA